MADEEELESEIIGSVMNNILRAASQKLPEDQMLEFGKLKTDFERMDYALKQDFVHELFSLEEPEYAKKSASEAKEAREKGNQYFTKKSYMSALDCYNKGVMLAPPGDEDNDLALTLANRSAALLHLNKHELCLQDVKYALEEGYPVDMQYKLYDRCGKSYMALKDPTQALQCFGKAKEMLEQAKLDNKGVDLWTKTIEKQEERCAKIVPSYKGTAEKVVPKINGEKHENLPGASSVVEIKYSKEKGRYAVAKSNIRVGDVFLRQKPFAWLLYPECYHNHCYHCLKRLTVPLPCLKTSNVVFCSKGCRQVAWDTYHQVEYQYQNVLGRKWCARIGHLAFRLCWIMGYNNLKEYLLKAKEESMKEVDPLLKGVDSDGKYSDKYDAVFNMETNIKKRLPEGLWDFAIFAVYIVKVLQASGFFKQDKDSTIDDATLYHDDLVLFGAGVLRHLQAIQCNGYGITEVTAPTDFEYPHIIEIGVGLYPTAALLNHDCDPAADLIYYNNEVTGRATRNIYKGEEITIDYGVRFYKNVKREREGKLMYRYCFTCLCPACIERWPLFRELENEIPLFRCSECRKELNMGGKLVDNTYIRCSKCNGLNNLKEGIGKLQISHDVYSANMQEALHLHTEEALPALERHLVLMQELMLPPWRDLTTCQAAIRQCYRLRGNCKEV